MSRKNWKLLFQEKALFLKLLESDSGKLTRAEALVLVQGEGRRLDDLVRAGWILILEEEVFSGAGLMLVNNFHDSSLAELTSMWEWSKEQLQEDITKMEMSESLQLREQAGALVFEKLVALRSWTFLLHAAILEESQSDGEKIATEFDSLAGELRSVTLRSSGFPEWEVAQWQLIDFLEERAAYLRVGEGPEDSDRLRKLRAISRLREEELLYETNLESIVKSGDFLLLHKKLGIVSWPFFPLQEKNQNPSHGTAEIQVEKHESSSENLSQEWRISGLDLASFLEKNAVGMHLTEEEKLETFSRILAESGEGVVWKKDSSGKKWEVWPGN